MKTNKSKIHPSITNPNYDSNKAVDWMLAKFKCKNDAALSRQLEVAPPVISKIRHKRLPIGDSLLVKIHELLEMGTKQIKSELGLA